MPINNTNQPKPFFNLSPLTFLLIKPPINMPAMAIKEICERKIQSISKLPRSPVKPINEFSAIINNEVPTASFMGNPTKRTSVGISKKPPPAPNTPVAIPTATP